MEIQYSPEQLVSLLKDQNRTAFEYVIDRYAPVFYSSIVRLVPDETVSEQILVRVFGIIYARINEYDAEKASFFTWMFMIVLEQISAWQEGNRS